jgi:hypothetical protein
MMTKFPSTHIAAICSKKAGNGLTDPRRKNLLSIEIVFSPKNCRRASANILVLV